METSNGNMYEFNEQQFRVDKISNESYCYFVGPWQRDTDVITWDVYGNGTSG